MKATICSRCGHYGAPAVHTRGSLALEIVLWLLLLVPGLIYSLWRVMTRTQVCAACESSDIMPVDTPRGQRLMQEYHADADPPRRRRRVGDAVVDYLNNTP